MLCSNIRLPRSFVELVNVDGLLHRTMIETLSLPQLLLVSEFLGEWFINLSLAIVTGIVPQS